MNKLIKVDNSVPRSGKTRKILKQIINPESKFTDKEWEEWIENSEKVIPTFFTVNMVTDKDNKKSTVSSTIDKIREINENCRCVIVVGKNNICDILINSTDKSNIEKELICKSCLCNKKFSNIKIDELIKKYDTSIFSFNELRNLSKDGYCPNAFSISYSKICDIAIMSISKLEVILKYKEGFFLKDSYNLICDEAHSLMKFNMINDIWIKDSNIEETIKIVFKYSNVIKYIGNNFNSNICEIYEEEITNLINIIQYSLDNFSNENISEGCIIKQSEKFLKIVDIFNNSKNEEDKIFDANFIEFNDSINKLNNVNNHFVVVDNKVNIRFYEVEYNNEKIVIKNDLKEELLNNAKNIRFITATPIFPMFKNLWVGNNGFEIKTVPKTEFEGKYTIFYHLSPYRVGVDKTHGELYYNNQQVIASLYEYFGKDNKLWVVARSKKEMEKGNKNISKIKTFDDYISSSLSEGVQRNEQLLVLYGIGFIPSNDYDKSSLLFRNTIEHNISVKSIRSEWIKMLSMQRTIQSMFRNADNRQVNRGCFIVNIIKEDLKSLKEFSIGNDKGIIFHEIPIEISYSNYGRYIKEQLEKK